MTKPLTVEFLQEVELNECTADTLHHSLGLIKYINVRMTAAFQIVLFES